MSYWIGKRVVSTGGAGFLGSHVLEKLRERGCEHFFVVRSQGYDLTKEAAVARLFSTVPMARRNDFLTLARRKTLWLLNVELASRMACEKPLSGIEAIAMRQEM